MGADKGPGGGPKQTRTANEAEPPAGPVKHAPKLVWTTSDAASGSWAGPTHKEK
jgi:hypothetical protein